MKAKILFALSALLMLGSVSLNAQEVGNSSNSESTTQLEGDLNHDNKVDVADVTYLVNIIMNQSTSENIPVTGVSVSPTSATISVNGTQQLSATVSPSNATNKSVTWSSSNTSVATVSSSGLVTGVSAGTATITVKTNDGNKTATSTITVQQSQPQPTSNYYWYIGVENPENISGISNVQTDNTVAGWHLIGSSLSGFVLDTDVTPVHLSDTRVIYYVIIPNGLNIYDALGDNGEYMFTSVVSKISSYKAFRCIPSDDFPAGTRDVRGVILKQSEDIPVTGVSVSPTSATINVNGTQQLSATVSPSDATNKSVTWSSSNTSVATVSSSGLVTGVSAGNATITVKTNDGNKTATSTITVQQSQPQPTSNYYWYIGVENSSSISNVQTDNTVAGWHEIGSSLSGFILNTDTNPVHISDTRVTYYIIIPNDLHIYDGLGTNIEELTFDSVTCNISGYKAFKWNAEKDGGGFDGVRNVLGIILKQ